MRKPYRRPIERGLPVVGAIALLALFLPQGASAYHEGVHLEVTPEVQAAIPVGTSATLTALLVGDEGFPTGATSDIEVRFENEGGASDFDGTTPSSPDASCLIPASESSCSVELEGRAAGRALVRAWFGAADTAEDRFAGPEDCGQPGDSPSWCTTSQTNGLPTPGTSCGTAPATTQAPGTEPDCTDVVEVVFTESAAATLDCDDATAPNTEEESNPHASTAPGNPSTETYTCVARDGFGNLKPGVRVNGENLAGANDPDARTSFTSADYGCDTTADDPITTTANERGSCKIAIQQQTPPQSGSATICFWVGTLSEGADLCPTEQASAGTNHEGSDAQGDNNVDVVQLTWESLSDLVIDCSPETGFSLVNNAGSIECTALSSATSGGVQGVTIRAETTGANDPDDSDTPQTQDAQPDSQGNLNELKCQTGPNGRCAIRHRGTDSGETSYRIWIDDGNPEPTGTNGSDADADLAEGRNEQTTPGGTGEPDATDVVISVWGNGPTTLVSSPESSSAAVGDCHEITVITTDEDGNPAGGVRIDVEQQHERFRNTTPSDEPIVGFCTPVAGPNPSDVDPMLGDLQPSGGGPNTSGSAGGETVGFSDTDGQITIGVLTQPAQSSDGSGTTYVTTWWEASDNDDPSGGEPSDTSLVTWVVEQNAAALELTPDTGSEDVGGETTYTATVTRNGDPIPGVEVSWSSSGAGTFTWTDTATDDDGQATATVSSEGKGSMTITASCIGQFTCSDTSTQNWGPAMCDVIGTDGADVLTGTEAPETICGFAGDDLIHGGGGDDVLIGSLGNDGLFGDAGLDQLVGGSGDDDLSGGADDDKLFGGNGDDTASGGAGNDYLAGDAGRDRLLGNLGNDDLRGGDGPDVLIGGRGYDSLEGQAGRDRCHQGSADGNSTSC